MKLYIPACGDRLVLTKAWEFDLYLEHRNLKFAQVLGLYQPKPKEHAWNVYESGERWGDRLKRARAALPEGTVLECDRVYIRTFSKSAVEVGNDFDSITWKVIKNGKPQRNSRFWAKLPDCYEIEYRLETDGLYRDRVKTVKYVLES